MEGKVLVAMSGGVDSAVTAMLLKEQGYIVSGIHFQLFNRSDTDINIAKLNRISELLGIEIIHHDVSSLFQKEVIDYFVSMHAIGKTPSLCARCNPRLKWKVLLDMADAKGYDFIATGHYIRIVKESGLFRIYKGTDSRKDQSYYLWGLQQDVLKRALSPLGMVTKEEVKNMAVINSMGFLVKQKESTGLCFSQGLTYNELLDKETNESHQGRQPGKVKNPEGEVIGLHNGYLYYTVGQKKNLNIFSGDKLCVSVIHPEDNVLEADTWQNLYTHHFTLDTGVFPDSSELSSVNIQTKVRGFGLNPEGGTTIVKLNDNLWRVTLEKPAWAVAKGQPAVFYEGDKLLGGGLVC